MYLDMATSFPAHKLPLNMKSLATRIIPISCESFKTYTVSDGLFLWHMYCLDFRFPVLGVACSYCWYYNWPYKWEWSLSRSGGWMYGLWEDQQSRQSLPATAHAVANLILCYLQRLLGASLFNTGWWYMVTSLLPSYAQFHCLTPSEERRYRRHYIRALTRIDTLKYFCSRVWDCQRSSCLTEATSIYNAIMLIRGSNEAAWWESCSYCSPLTQWRS